MIEIKQLEKLKVNFLGTVYELTKPNRILVKPVQEKLKNAKGEELDVLCDFLVSSGLPQEVADQLQLEHIQQIFEGLVGSKKK